MRFPANLLTALTFALLAGPAPAQTHPERLHVHGAYARALPGQGASATVYFLVHNNTSADLRLTGASCACAAEAGLHGHVESAEGVMQMRAIEGGIALPAGEMHEFVRGGDHVMLSGLTSALADGDIITLTLTFDAGPPLTVSAVVDNARKPGTEAMHDH